MHEPVLLEEVVDLLEVRNGGLYIDGTAGSGGHSEAVLKASTGSRVLAIDRDAEAVERTARRLADYSDRVRVVQGAYSEMSEIAGAAGFDNVNGILLDLGVSSEQLNEGQRGFSFSHDGPLDMRMDRRGELSAREVVNDFDEKELARILREYGEERKAGSIAKAIVRSREEGQIETTGALAEIVERAAGGRRGKTHPATRTFQALRIHVNGELDQLRKGLESGIELLGEGGRFAVISYHSLEDRIVKNVFRRHEGRNESLQEGGSRWVGDEPAVRRITKKPLVPSSEEIENNARARSAKLRVAERI